MGEFLWATALCGYDICFRRLPDWLTLPAACIAFYWHPLCAIGGLLWALLYFRPGVGGGDLKLALSLGTVALASSLASLLLAIALSSAITVLLGVMLKQKSVPHGPSMIGATYVVCMF